MNFPNRAATPKSGQSWKQFAQALREYRMFSDLDLRVAERDSLDLPSEGLLISRGNGLWQPAQDAGDVFGEGFHCGSSRYVKFGSTDSFIDEQMIWGEML